MILLLDFAVAWVNRRGGKKKNHGNQTNYKIDREYLSVNNSVNNNKKELDQNQESSPLLRWSLTRQLQSPVAVR